MIINKQGLSLESLTNNLSNKIKKMQTTLGSGFSLKAEGVIDNIIVALAIMEYNLEQQMAYLIKQFDPKTADGEYQDALYERIALYRNDAVPTTFTLNITGTNNIGIAEESIEIKSSNGEVFMNANFEFDNNGEASVCFKSLVKKAVNISKSDEFTIVSKPAEVSTIDFSSIENISIGRNEESDSEFRARFYSTQARPAKCTRNAVLENLSKYTDGLKFISIHDSNSDENIPAGEIEIIAKPTVSDSEFGKIILDNVICGLDFIGDTSVDVPLSNGQTWEVKFQKAQETNVELNAVVKIKKGYYQNYVFKTVRENMIAYFEKQQYGLNAEVSATDFVIPIIETEGVEAVTEITIKQSDGETYSESIVIAKDNYPVLINNHIHLQI